MHRFEPKKRQSEIVTRMGMREQDAVDRSAVDLANTARRNIANYQTILEAGW